MWYVYIIRSISFPDQEYIGATADLKRRLPEHNAGKSAHTAKFKPWGADLVLRLSGQVQGARLREISKILTPAAPSPRSASINGHPNVPNTAFNRSRNATISFFIATSSPTEQADAARIDCGTALAFSLSASPFGVSAISTWRSSSVSRVRLTRPAASSRFSSGVSVPESRKPFADFLDRHAVAFPQHQHHEILRIGETEPVQERLVEAVDCIAVE